MDNKSLLSEELDDVNVGNGSDQSGEGGGLYSSSWGGGGWGNKKKGVNKKKKQAPLSIPVEIPTPAMETTFEGGGRAAVMELDESQPGYFSR